MDRDEQEGVDKQAGEGEEESEGDETEEEQGGQEEPSVEEQCVSLLVCGCEREGNFLSSVGRADTVWVGRAREGPGHPEQFPVQGPDPCRGRGGASSGVWDLSVYCLSGADGIRGGH